MSTGPEDPQRPVTRAPQDSPATDAPTTPSPTEQGEGTPSSGRRTTVPPAEPGRDRPGGREAGPEAEPRSGGRTAERAAVEPLVLMLGPVAPHIAEELWSRLGNDESLAHGPWPAADEKWLVDDTVELPVQVNGKVRSRVSVAADASREDVEAIALADEKVAAYTAEGTVAKVIVVPGKMVNVVVKK